MMNPEITKAIEAIRSGNREKLERELLEPRFTAGDTEVKHRNITHWDKMGLLNHDPDNGKWRRYNYLDIIWLRIIAHLRSFNISLEVIQSLKDSLFLPSISSWDIYSSSLGSEVISKIALEMEGNLPDPINDPKKIEEMKNDMYSALFFMVSDAVLLRNHWSILVNKEGEAIPFKESQADQYEAFFKTSEFTRKTFMSVSLTEVIIESFRKIKVDILSDRMAILTSGEGKILQLLRQGELKSLKVTFDQDDEIDLIEETRVKKVEPEARLTELLFKDAYSTITAKTNNGKITYFETSTRYKLNKVLSADRPI
jgi:DNA-binding transcriptional MerR regulator